MLFFEPTLAEVQEFNKGHFLDIIRFYDSFKTMWKNDVRNPQNPLPSLYQYWYFLIWYYSQLIERGIMHQNTNITFYTDDNKYAILHFAYDMNELPEENIGGVYATKIAS